MHSPIITRIPCGYRIARGARDASLRGRAADYTADELAWYKRPLRGLAFVVALALGSHAAHADVAPAKHETADVIAARSEAKAAKEHLKRALDVQRTARKREHAMARMAKLQAEIAKLQANVNAAKIAPSAKVAPVAPSKVDAAYTALVEGDCGE